MDDPDSVIDSSATLRVAMGFPATPSLGPLLRQLRSPMDEIEAKLDDPDSSASLLGFPVTASLGPQGLLLRQLHSLTTVPNGVADEVRGFTKDLEGLCISLVEQSEAEEPSFTAKCWMREVRELCYDTKNYLDDITTCADPELRFIVLKARAMQASHRRQRYEIDQQNIKKAKYLSVGRRQLPVRHRELIDCGRIDVLATLLRNEEEKRLKVVSLVGLEGVGKTTLAERLYHQTCGVFRCGAFLRISPKPDIKRLLTNIFTQIRRHPPNCRLDAQDLITSIFDSLLGKRYLIILDDLWSTSVWDIIRRAFPDDGNGGRIITTTQIDDVALSCSSYQSDYIFEMEPLKDDQSQKLFFGLIFGSLGKGGCPESFARVSNGIIRKCGGLPLLIVNVASLLPTPSEINLHQWMDIRDSLPPTLRRDPTPEGMEQVVKFIYNNLSPELKTCLLYLAMYPEGYTVTNHDLLKQWVAEGFAGEQQTNEEIAGEYFAELVSRGMIQTADINRGVVSCTLHHMVHDLIVKISMEENFIITVDYFKTPIGLPEKARRLSVQFAGARSARIPDSIVVSEVRSLAYFGFYGCARFIVEYRLLRVLILHVWADQDEMAYDLTGLAQLFPLRYLKIACNIAVKLPDEIQALQYLETLEVDATVVAIPSDIGRLSRLSCLKIPLRELSRQDICILQALPALSALSLHVLAEPAEMMFFDKGEFSSLKYFKFTCSVPWVKFGAGSMPDLLNINLCFNAREADRRGIVPIGIEYLPGLKEITADIWGGAHDYIGTTFRTAISSHPRNPKIDLQLVNYSICCGDIATSMSKDAPQKKKKSMSKDGDKGEEGKKQAADSSMSTLPQSKRMSFLQGSSVPVQGSKSSKVVSALSKAQLLDGYLPCSPWDKMGEVLPVPKSSSFLSMLILPTVLDRDNSRYNSVDGTLARASAWFLSSKASGVPLAFVSVQTEGPLAKISGDLAASATVSSGSLADLPKLANEGQYGLEDYQGMDSHMVKAVRIWFTAAAGEIPVEITLEEHDTKLGFAICRTEEGFLYISSVMEDDGDLPAPSTRSGIRDLYREAMRASKLLVISRVSCQKVLPWMVSTSGAIRCFDTVSLSQKLSLHRHALRPILLHFFMWEGGTSTPSRTQAGQPPCAPQTSLAVVQNEMASLQQDRRLDSVTKVGKNSDGIVTSNQMDQQS